MNTPSVPPELRQWILAQAQAGQNAPALLAALVQAGWQEAQALAALPGEDRRNQRPGLMMAAIYRELLEMVAEEPGLVLTHRISLPPPRKLWLALKAWLQG